MIETENLTFRYRSDSPDVLKGINISIPKGQFLAVLGHNGSGKSTFAKLLNAVLLPTDGCVKINGIDTAFEDRHFEIRQTVGTVFQNPDNQIVSSVVEEDVAFGLENIGVPPEEMRERVDSALKTVGMYEYREHAPHRLSGGQKQRVAIAGIIAMRPQCIVLDEATAMLDPQGRAEVLETVRGLNKKDGITVIHITHYMEEALNADRVVVMERGEVLLDGTPKEVFSKTAAVRAAGLDVPQATELAFALRESGLPLADDIITEDECVKAVLALMTNNKGEQRSDENHT